MSEETGPTPYLARGFASWVVVCSLLLTVLAASGYFRFVGTRWGEEQYLHPDERFLAWVGTDVAPVSSISEYFDTASSTLNPHNRGQGFYVYGTLHLFAARYLAQWVYGHSGFMEITIVGRLLSATADLLTVFLVFLIAWRLAGQTAGLLAAAFYGFSVLPVQLSHYFKEDTFAGLFISLAIYFAVRIADGDRSGSEAAVSSQPTSQAAYLYSIGLGASAACGAACKITAGAALLLLPVAWLVRLMQLPAPRRKGAVHHAIACLLAAGIVASVVFRIAQPYAFSGPGFFGWKLNPRWLANMMEIRQQADGTVDMPPALQWARRPVWFATQNLVLWGMGLPLGLVSAVGFLWAGGRTLLRGLSAGSILFLWAAAHACWQSLSFNPTMRYQLPIYPTLAILAAWMVIALGRQRRYRVGALLGGGFVLLAALTWTYAFTRVYVRPNTRIAASRWILQNVSGPVNLRIRSRDGTYNQPLPLPRGQTVSPGEPYVVTFAPKVSGALREVYFPNIIAQPADRPWTVAVTVEDLDGARSAASTISRSERKEEGWRLLLAPPLVLDRERQYRLTLTAQTPDGTVELTGAAPANESSWDDGLPLRLDGYDPYGGIYFGGLNFEMYTDDNEEKRTRFVSVLNQADFLFISSNRQWASTTRVPERYPLTTAYYRHLLGCPSDRSVIWCYNVAQVGSFEGGLGFELARVFESRPSVGPFRINDQFAEEAFTVYDHPKVFIFRKTAAYSAERVRALLGRVDLSQAMPVAPGLVGSASANLMLPRERWAAQNRSGTWSSLFPSDAWQNRSEVVAAVCWYLSLSLLGLFAYPLLRLALPYLPDRGYPLARGAGLLALAYLVWLGGSFHIPFTRLTITVAAGLLGLAGGLVAYRCRAQLHEEWIHRRAQFFAVEVLFLVFFAIDLVIRIGNPDLWHPWRGGEKPMDFAFFNAVLKSDWFPPYDPWFAGGYLNYYYFGFVLNGVLAKWLGITPAVAVNLVVPTVFALIAMGAYSIGWNLADRQAASPAGAATVRSTARRRFLAGVVAAVGMAMLGNLGIVRMLFDGLARLGAPGGQLAGCGVVNAFICTLKGAVRVAAGAKLPYEMNEWYWASSRVIPAANEVAPITEFPFFSVLQADPHAHLFALPVALLVLSIILSVLLGHKSSASRAGVVAQFLLGGLAIGALYATNTWDFYPYLALGSSVFAFAAWRYWRDAGGHWSALVPGRAGVDLSRTKWRVMISAGAAILLAALSVLLFLPFRDWYAPGYGVLELWRGTRTPLTAYLTHWGLFLFVILSWLTSETRDWLAMTPVSALRRLRPYAVVIKFGVLLLAACTLLLLLVGVRTAWLVLPTAAWAVVLLARPGLTGAKRFVLLCTAAGLLLTLLVEVVVLRGDVARMNTVFKTYMQAWTLLSLSAAAAIVQLLDRPATWGRRTQACWRLAFATLVLSAALYPVFGTWAKIRDRMVPEAPHGLDGAVFLSRAKYRAEWGEMDLGEDYQAIRWLQEHVKGSPVIVEANIRDLYQWGSRFSIHTGLPGVVGWEWHARQQRAIISGDWVGKRIREVDDFYRTEDQNHALAFLRKYDVRYVVVGRQERGYYPGPGLRKFEEGEGVYWTAVYVTGKTVIYEVAR